MANFNFRTPVAEDAQSIFDLAQPYKPYIGTNPRYTYLLIATHFQKTSVVVEDVQSKQIVGFISGYLVPDTAEKTLFLWEIGVREGFHGNGLYLRMIHHLITKINPVWVEATTNPSNRSSVERLGILSKDMNAKLSASVLFKEALFGASNHEDELLYRIGPIHAQKND
jgi:L-2,4-diaminobutyric acid acetyltransferase